MICYFSGTGNSQIVAESLGEKLNDSVFSINLALKSGKKQMLTSEKSWVFVAPVYAWRMPKVMSDWMKATGFSGNKKAYFILTCGSSVGDASSFAKTLSDEIGLSYMGLMGLQMAENYLVMFPVPDKKKAAELTEKALGEVTSVAEKIRSEKPFAEAKKTALGKFLSQRINTTFQKFALTDKGYHCEKTCIDCGKCERLCPLNNIKIVDKKPQWLGNCTQCMACIACCPVEAIQYNKWTKKRHRHFIFKENSHD